MEAVSISSRQTKIIGTIGAGTQDVESLRKLIRAGMSIARCHYSYCAEADSLAFHTQTIANVREASRLENTDCAVLLDHCLGSVIRVGTIPQAITVDSGDVLSFRSASCNEPDTHSGLSIPFDLDLDMSTVCTGQIVKLQVGEVSCRVEFSSSQSISCRCLTGGQIHSGGVVSLPGWHSSAESGPRQSDLDFLRLAVETDCEFLAVSGVRSAEDIRRCRKALVDMQPKGQKTIPLCAKLENRGALIHFEGILAEADAILLGRGDLGCAVPFTKITMVQKIVIQRCNAVGKPVIVATQLLESMCTHQRPTRAEAADVTNAVLDGADCLLLSAETASGAFPVLAVSTLADLCRHVEAATDWRRSGVNRISELRRTMRGDAHEICRPEVLSAQSVKTAADLGVAAILVLSETGTTARLVATFRPGCPILCVSDNENTNSMGNGWVRGVWNVFIDGKKAKDCWDEVALGVDEAKRNGWLKTGDELVVVVGTFGVPGSAHTIRVLEVDSI